MSLFDGLQVHSSQPSSSRFIPKPLILVQRARASTLNSEIDNLTRAVEHNVLLVKRSLPSLPQISRSDSQITYLKNGSPLVGQKPAGSYVIPLPTPPMTPENTRTVNLLHSKARSARRTHLHVAPPASPLSTDITNSLLFTNDAPLLPSDPPPIVVHASGTPVPSSESPDVQDVDLLSDVTSSPAANTSQGRCKSAHASSAPILIAEHEETPGPDDIPNSESLCHNIFPPPLLHHIHDPASALDLNVPITTQQTADCLVTTGSYASDPRKKRPTSPPTLRIDVQQSIVLGSASFTTPHSPNTYTRSPSLRSVRVEYRPPTPPLRPLKPLPLRPVTRKPPPPIPVDLLPQTLTEISTVAFPSSISSPIPRTRSPLESWTLPPSPIPHRTPSTKVMSKLEPVIEVPYLESTAIFPLFSSAKGLRFRRRRSTSFEGARRRLPLEFLGLNKSTPDLRLETSSVRDRVGKGRDSSRARILSLCRFRRARTGSRPRLSISSPLSNSPSTPDTPLSTSTLFTSSPIQETSPPTPSPTIYKRPSSSFRRWTNFVAKIFEPSSSSRPSSPSTTVVSSRSLNVNAPPTPQPSSKPIKRHLLHGRSFSQGTDSPLRRDADEASVSGFCLYTGVNPGRRPSLP